MKAIRFMFWEMMAVYSENRTKYVNKRRERVEIVQLL